MLSKAAYRHLSRMTSMAELASFLKANAPKTRKSVKLARERKQVKAATHRIDTAAIREEVFRRASGRCEVDGFCRCDLAATEMDHWLGGNGRRRPKQSVETCWALCRFHHEDRTIYAGGVGVWNERFRVHCEKYGYPFVAHIEHAHLPEKQAVK